MQKIKEPIGIILSPQDIGNAIKTKRKADGLTQIDAAALCGVGTRFFGEIERGKETAQIGKIIQIMQRLGLVLQFGSRGVSR